MSEVVSSRRKEHGLVPAREELLSLYGSVGWTTYTRSPDGLVRAVANSTFVVSVWDEAHLVGLARCLSDDVSIMYLQDVLVAPSHRREGLGRELVRDCLARFSHVRQRVLLTDKSPVLCAFYENLGFSSVSRYREGELDAFVLLSE